MKPVYEIYLLQRRQGQPIGCHALTTDLKYLSEPKYSYPLKKNPRS